MRHALGIAVFSMAAVFSAAAAAPPATGPTTQPSPTYADEYARHEKYAGPRTPENLARLQKMLDAPETRLPALRELIDFAGPSLYQRGSMTIVYSDGSAQIRLQAAKLVASASDRATVLQALQGTDPILISWAIRRAPQTAEGESLLKQFAATGDETLRVLAIESLRGNFNDAAFIQQLAATEKSPYVLDEMLFAGNEDATLLFSQRVGDLLNDPDAKVRSEAISYVAANWGSAAMRQMFIDRTVMDGLLASARAGKPESAQALETFTLYSNQPSFADADTAAKWWTAHRGEWETARFPRSTPTNGGGGLKTSITTEGTVGGSPAWHASAIFENTSARPITLNVGKAAGVNWAIYDSTGQKVRALQAPGPRPTPNYVQLDPGKSVTVPLPILNSPPSTLAPWLKPGRYILKADLEFDSDNPGAPPEIPMWGGQIPLPAIVVEVAAI